MKFENEQTLEFAKLFEKIKNSSSVPAYQVLLDEEYLVFPEYMNAHLTSKYYYILLGPNSSIIMEPEKDFESVLDKLWDPSKDEYKANIRILQNIAMLVTVEEGELRLPDRYLKHLNTNGEEIFIYAYVMDGKIILSAEKIRRKNTLILFNEYGQEKEYTILFTVQLDTSGADYIAYTNNINVDLDHMLVKYARYNKNELKLEEITSEEFVMLEDIYKKIMLKYKEHSTEGDENIVVALENK